MPCDCKGKLLSIRKEVEPSPNTPRVRLVHLYLFNGGHYQHTSCISGGARCHAYYQSNFDTKRARIEKAEGRAGRPKEVGRRPGPGERYKARNRARFLRRL